MKEPFFSFSLRFVGVLVGDLVFVWYVEVDFLECGLGQAES